VVDYDIDFMHNNFRNPTVQRVFVFVGPGGSRNPNSRRLRLRKEFNATRSTRPSALAIPTSIWLTPGAFSHMSWTSLATGKPQADGVAPAADLIFVHIYGGDVAREDSFATRTLLEAVDYIFTKAAELGKSAVVNLSLGTHADRMTVPRWQNKDVLLKDRKGDRDCGWQFLGAPQPRE